MANLENCIKIIVTGDFSPINGVEKAFLEKDYQVIYNDVYPLLQDTDLSITNLECPLTNVSNPIAKSGPNLIADPGTILGIKYGGFNVATLANNHIFDQGESGQRDTINTCIQNNIKIVGAGSNLDEASIPLFVEIKGKKIAILNFAESEFGIATQKSPGANPLEPISNYYQIKDAKEKSDYVFVIIHGGHEYYEMPSPRMRKTYRFFADIGVSAVIGHHTHCASGYEIYNGVPIFYSLGNFLFDKKGIPYKSWYEGFFVIFKICNEGLLTYDLVYYNQSGSRPGLQLKNGKDKEEFVQNLQKISERITDDTLLNSDWKEFLKSRNNSYFYRLFSLNKLFGRLIRKKLFRGIVFNNKALLQTLNIIRCQSHRDILIESLQDRINKRYR